MIAKKFLLSLHYGCIY